MHIHIQRIVNRKEIKNGFNPTSNLKNTLTLDTVAFVYLDNVVFVCMASSLHISDCPLSRSFPL